MPTYKCEAIKQLKQEKGKATIVHTTIHTHNNFLNFRLVISLVLVG